MKIDSRWIVPLLIVIAIVLTGALIPSCPFGSDEGDNLLGAQSILRGGDIYRAFYSQHMPFGYYFSALIGLCGAKSVLHFRIGYVLFLALFWGWLYWAYARRVPSILLLFLIVAFPLAAPWFLGHVILADNLSGLALVVLMMELISHRKPEDLTPQRMVVISAAVFAAVTSTFLSLYPVFAFLAGMALLDIQESCWRVSRITFRRYLMLAAVIAIPFALLGGWYLLTGNFGRFWYQAYEFNRTVYPKYINIGGRYDAIMTFINLPVAWIRHGQDVLGTAIQTRSMSLGLLMMIANLAFIFWAGRGWLFSMILFVFLTYTGTRGFGGFGHEGFHSAPYYLVSLVSLGWLISILCRPRLIKAAALIGLVFFFLNITLPVYGKLAQFNPAFLKQDPLFPIPGIEFIRPWINPGEPLWSASINGYLYIDTHCPPASRVWGLVPWYGETYLNDIIADLEKTQPKVIYFPAELAISGRKLIEYAHPIYNYIQQHYRPLDKEAPVRRDLYILVEPPAAAE